MNIKLNVIGLVFALSVFLIFSSVSIAGEKPSEKITGTLICLGCDLKKSHDAEADCMNFGHKHGLKTSDGKVFTFLENRKSNDLISGKMHSGKKVNIHGRILKGTHIIEVDKVKLADTGGHDMSAVCSMCEKKPCACNH